MDRVERATRHQYITARKADACVYVEGTYDQEFIDFLKALPKNDRAYEPEAKRWKVNIAHLTSVINKARNTFTKVFYSVGGDYEEITIGGVTWQQIKLDL